MSVARWFSIVMLMLVAGGAARAQTCNLTEKPRVNDCHQLRLTMTLTGEMVVLQEGQSMKLKLAATAEHRFRERVLAVHPAGDAIAKAARIYDDARASIAVDRSVSPRVLRPERRLIVAQRPDDTLLCYSPQGPLTREELETVSEHFDTLALAGLLPGKEVKVGDTWQLNNTAAQALCLFEGLISNELTGKLVSDKDGVAVFTVQGTAKGIELGAQAKVTVNATGRYDLARQRVVALEWKQKDERDQGPASPAANVETTITLARQIIEEPKELSDVALVSVPQGFDVPEPLQHLTVRDVKGRYEVACSRDWQVVSQTESHLVLRLLDRGDFVAQASVSAWTKAEPGQHSGIPEFRNQVLSSPGWQPEEVIQEEELPKLPNGRFVYRLVARGDMDGVKVIQSFFLVAGAQGDQAVVAITLKQTQAAKLGIRDLMLVDGVSFPSK